MKNIYLVNILSIIAIIIFFFSNFLIKNETYGIVKNVLCLFGIFNLLYINGYYFQNALTKETIQCNHIACHSMPQFVLEYGLLIIVIISVVFIMSNITDFMVTSNIMKTIINFFLYGGAFFLIFTLYNYLTNDSINSTLGNKIFKKISGNLYNFINLLNSKSGLLVLIEIILISLYFIVPYVLGKISNGDAITLLGNKPKYLSKEHIIGTYENLHNNNNDKHIYNYTISCCFYINPQYSTVQKSGNNFINIINYGNKPSVQYDNKTNSLFIKSINNDSNDNIILKKWDVPLQKWNNLVVQYNNGLVDIFINGNIIVSKKNQIPFMKYDKVVIGDNNGLEGGIKNIKYYPRNLRLDEIKMKAIYCN